MNADGRSGSQPKTRVSPYQRGSRPTLSIPFLRWEHLPLIT